MSFKGLGPKQDFIFCLLGLVGHWLLACDRIESLQRYNSGLRVGLSCFFAELSNGDFLSQAWGPIQALEFVYHLLRLENDKD